MRYHHRPVLVAEVVAALKVRPGGAYVDCTVGEGGHALAVLGAVEPAPRLLGIDMDADALSAARERLRDQGERVALVHGSFADLLGLASQGGFQPADGVLFDLGLSSLQLDEAERGFSFSKAGRLDMRFDTSRGVTARQVVNRYAERELADIIRRFGEEPMARRIARAIVRARPIETTAELADVIRRAAARPGRAGIHPATRTFQALRIAVNQEFDNLKAGLDQAIEALGHGGRLVVISYHSLEDRLVKRTFQREKSDCICPAGTPECVCGHRATMRVIGRKVIRPTAEEVRANPRGRSARMRVAERL